jgi:hypothetical protein
MTDLTQLLIGGIPLLAIIFGLVEFSKTFGLKGWGLTTTSLLLGVVFGIAYKITVNGLPVDFAAWFVVIVFGLALGLITSGFYDFADKRFPQFGIK